MSREPHRDTRNGPCGTYFQVLSEVVGGGLWIAHKNGCIARSHNGAQVQGFDLEAKEVPVVLMQDVVFMLVNPGTKQAFPSGWC